VGAEGSVTYGSLALNLASVVKHTKQEYLTILERNSQRLEQQHVKYNSISGNSGTKFFYETYETPLPSGGTIMVYFSKSKLRLKAHENLKQYLNPFDDPSVASRKTRCLNEGKRGITCSFMYFCIPSA
jgi:hypothetical protein